MLVFAKAYGEPTDNLWAWVLALPDLLADDEQPSSVAIHVGFDARPEPVASFETFMLPLRF